ncbi:MAG: hypothetical protein AAB049_07155, partial [Nitrospirota bacterium]
GGVFKVRTTGEQGSGILTSMVKANCLIDIPQEVEKLSPGDTVTVQILSAQLWDRTPVNRETLNVKRADSGCCD